MLKQDVCRFHARGGFLAELIQLCVCNVLRVQADMSDLIAASQHHSTGYLLTPLAVEEAHGLAISLCIRCFLAAHKP
jgi:hypothetical protein